MFRSRQPALTRLAGVLSLLVLLLPAAPIARAQRASREPGEQLTSRGRFLIDGSVGGSFSHDDTGGPDVLKRWRVYMTPSLSYFLRDRVGVGVALGAGVTESQRSPGTTYAFTAQDRYLYVGLSGAFDLPLTSRLSLLFQPELGYTNQWGIIRRDFVEGAQAATFQQQAPGSLHFQQKVLRGVLNIRVLIRMSSALAIGVGPDVWVDYIFDDENLRAVQNQRPAYYPDDETDSPKPQYVRVQLGLSVGLWFSL